MGRSRPCERDQCYAGEVAGAGHVHSERGRRQETITAVEVEMAMAEVGPQHAKPSGQEPWGHVPAPA